MNPFLPDRKAQPDARTEELLQVHQMYCTANFLTPDNFKDILSQYSAPDLTGFGTGKDEVIVNLENFFPVLVRAKEQSPPDLTFSLENRQVKLVGDVGIISNIVHLSFKLAGEEVTIFPRLSAIYHYAAANWSCVHFHLSLPAADQPEGDSYPLDALKARNEELQQLVEARTAELRLSLENLQTTQAQLIQSEKMASLGELTAGIAHEIQNPLNFVNNFSEVSAELLEELAEELQKGETAEALAIAADVKENLQKINHHGKRADSIVKNMLQHSRSSSGSKEWTDLNALIEEYFRLSYHGLRAKNKNFNAELITHFTPGLEKINLVPQDIGRVLLNLFNNAFYAVEQKQKQADIDYKPVVEVSTGKEGNLVWVKVKDNGSGIPDKIKEKIMQPFFTTKPSGEGTGLGLSLSYDIILKGHGGKLSVISDEGAYTEFTISIPLADLSMPDN